MILPSSLSVAVAEQVNVVPVKTPVFGVIAAVAEKVGAVLIAVTVAESVPSPLSKSVAVTTHSIMSSGTVAVPDKSNVASAVRLRLLCGVLQRFGWRKQN